MRILIVLAVILALFGFSNGSVQAPGGGVSFGGATIDRYSRGIEQMASDLN